MRFLRAALMAFVATLVAIGPATVPASAAKRAKAVKPTIVRVTPMRLEVGETLTIRGKHFKAKKGRNTVVFRGPGGRTAFAKPRRASSRKLVVKVPASVARLLTVKDGRQRPTRLQLRVLAGSFSAFTPRRLSPVVLTVGANTPGGGGVEGKPLVVCNKTADHDGDLLSNAVEIEHGTDPCLADTDGDGATDGWEFYSAKDLNLKAVPYPGKRPYPNPLDPEDLQYDFDGDGLLAREEYRAWVYTGRSFDPARLSGNDLESALGYSDGTQFSRATEVPAVPAWRGPAFGLPAPAAPFPETFNLHDDPAWRDDERDADRDGLANFLESARGPRDATWWAGFWAQEKYTIEPWPASLPTCDDQAPGSFAAQRPFAALDLADPDVDGDGLLDGEDDQDNDDFNNIVETYETVVDLDDNGQVACGYAWIPSIAIGSEERVVNAFNPCAPNQQSRTCPPFAPF
jgi:hypothetical protein